MKSKQRQHIIKAWPFRDVLLEQYCYAPGPSESIPKHCHEEYQLCLKLDSSGGEYQYRGVCYPLHMGSLCIFQPGEVHSSRAEYRHNPVTYRLMYASPALLQTVASEVSGQKSGLPFWENPIILDGNLAKLFLEFHANFGRGASKLEQESLLVSLLAQLIRLYSDATSSIRPVGRERESVKRVCEYLQDNYAENVSLDYLARVADLSPYHLHRVFHNEVGLPPHQYQIQVRVSRARALLSRGVPISRVALKTGFADQSHLTRHFRRIVKVTPGRYIPQK